MGDTKWFGTFEEMRDYVSAESRGDAGEEFKLKEYKKPSPKKRNGDQGDVQKNGGGPSREGDGNE